MSPRTIMVQPGQCADYASQLRCRPTQSKLNKRYIEGWLQRKKLLVSIKTRADLTLDQEHPSLLSLVSRLQRDGIEIVRPPTND